MLNALWVLSACSVPTKGSGFPLHSQATTCGLDISLDIDNMGRGEDEPVSFLFFIVGFLSQTKSQQEKKKTHRLILPTTHVNI